MSDDVTRWRIVSLPNLPQRAPHLVVTLACDTRAPRIVRAIEAAARGAGIELTRVDETPGGDRGSGEFSEVGSPGTELEFAL